MVRVVLVGGWMCLASAGSWALSLGGLQGQVTIGQPLKLILPVAAGASESISPLCPLIRVYFADDLVPAAQLRVETLNDVPGSGGARIRIQTTSPVMEPFVKVEAVAGCGNQFSRSYTLLADLPVVESETQKKALSQALPTGSSPRLANKPERDALGDSVEAVSLSERRPLRVPSEGRASSADQPVRGPLAGDTRRNLRTSAPAAAQPVAHLKLDPVELLASASTLSPTLRISIDLAQGVNDLDGADEALQKRRAAALALWRALNDSPEDVASVRVQAETSATENRQLKASVASARQAEQAALQQAEDARDAVYTHPLTLTALLVGLSSLAGLIVILLRQKKPVAGDGRAWWQRVESEPKSSQRKPLNIQAWFQTKLATLPWFRRRTSDTPSQIDIDIDTLMPEPEAASPRDVHAGDTGRPSEFLESRIDVASPSDFLVSTLVDGARSVATEELLDLQQQVEFFISLGQADQAVEVLVNHLSDSHEPSPLAYLDLLKLYHELGRRSEYESLRTEFNRLFRGGAPEFDSYSHSRRGLERYESAMSRIQSLWPRPEVLDVIERSIFRQGLGDQDFVFDLEAYRELLLLYSVARELNAPNGDLTSKEKQTSGSGIQSDSRAIESAETELNPLSALTPEQRLRADAAVLPPVKPREHTQEGATSHAVGSSLDIDLSAAFGFPDTHPSGELSIDLDLTEEGSFGEKQPTAEALMADDLPDVDLGVIESIPQPVDDANGSGSRTSGGLDFSELVDKPLVIRKGGERL